MELDGGLDLGDLPGEVFAVGDGGGELSGFGETGAEETERSARCREQRRIAERRIRDLEIFLGGMIDSRNLPRDLLDESLRSQEGIVILSKLLDELLVLHKNQRAAQTKQAAR